MRYAAGVSHGVFAALLRHHRHHRLESPRHAGPAAAVPAQLAKAVLVGFVGYYLSSYLDFAGLQYISAQLERLILMTYPVFVTLLGRRSLAGG